MKKVMATIPVAGKSKTVTVMLDDTTAALLEASGDPALIAAYVEAEYHVRNLERREKTHCVSLESIAEKGHDFEADAPDPLQVMIKDEQRGHLCSAMSCLTKQQRAVFSAHVADSLSFSEIAENMGLSKCRVWELYHAAEKKLKNFPETP